MDSHLRVLAARQADVVAAWQLRDAGWSSKKVHHHARTRGWYMLHPGVYILTAAPPSRRQLWFAAVLTARDSVLSHGSAGACYGFYRFERDYEVVTRPGQGGRRRHGGVVVFRSKALADDVTAFRGIRITTAARVLIDLAPRVTEKEIGRAFRESIRLRCTRAWMVQRALQRYPRRCGTPLLRALATRYARIPYHRTRSDPEGRALEVLHDAGVEPPLVNLKVAGREADLVWPRRKLIIEIDGPQFHQFPDVDAEKEGLWHEAGHTVRRINSDAVYDTPELLIARALD